jgi:acetyltransferase-like isoleucine patch superfamily enzyme
MKFNQRNIFISSKAKIGKNVRIGDNTVIYDNVEIGDNTTICNDCVIGEPLNSYYFDEHYDNPVTKIGENSLIRSHCIFYAGSEFGKNLITGHRVTVREKSKIGESCLISTLVDIQGNCTIGNFSRLYSNVHVCEFTKIGNFVFVYPFVIFTNDPQPPSNNCNGPTVGDYTQIAVHCCILPNVIIGENCLIGANSVINRNFGDELFIVGSPAKVVCSVREIKSKEKKGEFHYPWMYNFERGMPWEGLGYLDWKNKK